MRSSATLAVVVLVAGLLSYEQRQTAPAATLRRAASAAPLPPIEAPAPTAIPLLVQKCFAGRSGLYRSKNEVKTIADLRRELQRAGYAKWQTDTDPAIMVSYMRATHTDLTPCNSASLTCPVPTDEVFIENGSLRAVETIRRELKGAGYAGWAVDSPQKTLQAYQRTAHAAITPCGSDAA